MLCIHVENHTVPTDYLHVFNIDFPHIHTEFFTFPQLGESLRFSKDFPRVTSFVKEKERQMESVDSLCCIICCLFWKECSQQSADTIPACAVSFSGYPVRRPDYRSD